MKCSTKRSSAAAASHCDCSDGQCETGIPRRDLLKLGGLVNSRKTGKRLELVLVNYSDADRELLEGLSPRSLEVIELNLEEAFIEYTRGPKRSLPIFAGGESDAPSTGDKGAA